jgi:hypothetical protein
MIARQVQGLPVEHLTKSICEFIGQAGFRKKRGEPIAFGLFAH